jgi:ParB family chromosome partitioning protein
MSALKGSENPVGKKRKKMALGRGLDALIPEMAPIQDAPQENRAKSFFLCDIDLIQPNRYQPRSHFSSEE